MDYVELNTKVFPLQLSHPFIGHSSKSNVLRKMCIIRSTFILFLFFFTTTSIAQIDSSQVDISPYSAIYNHLYYLQQDSYDPGRAALSFPDTDLDNERVAIMLKGFLDGKGYYIDLNRVPKESDFIDSTLEEPIYFLTRIEPRIYVERIDGRWLYSTTTTEQAEALYKMVYPWGSDFMSYFSDPIWKYSVLGLTLFQYFGFLVLVISAWIIYLVFRWIVQRLFTRGLKRYFGLPESVDQPISKSTRIIGLLISIRFILFFSPILHLPIVFGSQLVRMFTIASIVLVVYFFIQAASLILYYIEDITKRTASTMDDQLLPILRRLVYGAIWAIGIIYILDYLDVNVTALLAGISIGGLALALAAQDTVKNFFGSLMIFLDRPFQVGDWISFDDSEGVVEEVGVRSTRIRSFADSLYYVPNGMLANKVIDNIGLRNYRRFKIVLGITYNTPPEKIEEFVKGIRELLTEHPMVANDNFEVHLNDMAASSLNILVYCFINTGEWKVELKTRHELILSFLHLVQDLDISYAFPSQSIYVESMKDSSG